MLDCKASDRDDPTEDPRFGKVGKQTIKDTGPLTKKRMETIDDEIEAKSLDFIKRQHKAGKPFFTWINYTHMHFRTHAKPESIGQSGVVQSEYHDAMIDHDKNVGAILDLIDELGIADNTIVLYSTETGHTATRGPMPVRRPSAARRIPIGKVPTAYHRLRAGQARSMRAASPTRSCRTSTGSRRWSLPPVMRTSRRNCSRGYKANGKSYKVHLDGYNFLPYLTGKEKKGPRKEFFYFSDEGDLMGLRYNNWKVLFLVQDQEGTMEIWQRKFRGTRMPYIYNLRTDPYEFATVTSNTYWDWYIDHAFLMYPMGDVVGEFLATFKEYPPRMKAGSWDMGKALEALQTPHNN